MNIKWLFLYELKFFILFADVLWANVSYLYTPLLIYITDISKCFSHTFKHFRKYLGTSCIVVYVTYCASFIRVCLLCFWYNSLSKYVAYVLTLIRKSRTKMCIRLRDNTFQVFGIIISLYAAAPCRKELPVEFWRTFKESRCDIRPACY